MGQHKYNPIAKLAREGTLPPKPPKKSKKAVEREICRHLKDKLYRETGLDKFLSQNY